MPQTFLQLFSNLVKGCTIGREAGDYRRGYLSTPLNEGKELIFRRLEEISK